MLYFYVSYDLLNIKCGAIPLQVLSVHEIKDTFHRYKIEFWYEYITSAMWWYFEATYIL